MDSMYNLFSGLTMTAALSLLASPAAAQQPVELSILRSQAAGGLTAVDAIAEIDPAMLMGGGSCDYRVEVAIHDSAGGAPVTDEWQRGASCESLGGGAHMRLVDSFSFAVRPGRYEVSLTVRPGAGGAARTARATFRSLPADAMASDLYLAREVGWADSLNAGAWAVRKGSIGIAAEAVMDVPLNRPFIGYYLELYPGDEVHTGGTVVGTIHRREGGRVIDFQLQQVDSLVSDRPIAGTMSVAGLPRGDYRLEVAVSFDDGVEVAQSRDFSVVEARRASPEPVAQPSPDALQRYFSRQDSAQLARFDALALWLETEQGREQFRSLSTDGRRQYLVEFFRRAQITGPSGATLSGEDALRTYLTRVTEVDREFGERSGEDNRRAGWQTDRGRLYMLYGAPADRIRRPFPGNDSRPYEIWYYNIGAGYVYLFVDEVGFGGYRLLYSTDPREPTLPGWQRRAGVAAVNELDTYYGIQREF